MMFDFLFLIISRATIIIQTWRLKKKKKKKKKWKLIKIRVIRVSKLGRVFRFGDLSYGAS